MTNKNIEAIYLMAKDTIDKDYNKANRVLNVLTGKDLEFYLLALELYTGTQQQRSMLYDVFHNQIVFSPECFLESLSSFCLGMFRGSCAYKIVWTKFNGALTVEVPEFTELSTPHLVSDGSAESTQSSQKLLLLLEHMLENNRKRDEMERLKLSLLNQIQGA